MGLKLIHVSKRGHRKYVSTGEITNLISVDAQKIQDAFIDLHFAWTYDCFGKSQSFSNISCVLFFI